MTKGYAILRTTEKKVRIGTLGTASRLGNALVVLRQGNAIEGKVLNKSFVIEVDDLGELEFPANELTTIIMKNLPTFPLDVIRFPSGNEISGTVKTDPLIVKISKGKKLTIALAKVLSILF